MPVFQQIKTTVKKTCSNFNKGPSWWSSGEQNQEITGLYRRFFSGNPAVLQSDLCQGTQKKTGEKIN